MRVGGRCCSFVVGVVVLGWRLVAGLHYVDDLGLADAGLGRGVKLCTFLY